MCAVQPAVAAVGRVGRPAGSLSRPPLNGYIVSGLESMVAWGTFTKSDGETYRQIEVSDRSDWSLFEQVAKRLTYGLRGTWIERPDGPDQRYWDLEAAGGKVTLHLEHYLGITIYPTAGAAADSESLLLLTAAYELLAEEGAV